MHGLGDALAVLPGRLVVAQASHHGARIDLSRSGERRLQPCALRIVPLGVAGAAAVVRLASGQHMVQQQRPPQRVAALQEAQQRRRIELQAAMDVAVLARRQQGRLAAFGRHPQPFAHGARQRHAALLVADVPGQHGRRRGALAEVMQQRRPARRQGCGQARRHVDHQQHVDAGVDLRVMVRALRHAPQAVQFGQQARQRAALAQHGEQARRCRLHQPARQFLPDPLGHQRIDLAGGHHPLHQRLRCGCHAEVGKARGKARQPQDSHRVLGKGGAHVAQHARGQILPSAVRIDQRAVGSLRDGVDGQVAPREVVLQRHLGRGVEGKAVVAGRGLALGACQRVFLVRLRVQEDGKVAPHWPVAGLDHLLRGGAHHHPVAVGNRPSEQGVAHAAAHGVDLHRQCSPSTSGSARAASTHCCIGGNAKMRAL